MSRTFLTGVAVLAVGAWLSAVCPAVAADAKPKPRLTSEAVDGLAKTDNVGLLDPDPAARARTAQRIGELADPAKVVEVVTEILDGKTQFTHLAYANSAIQAIGHCAVANKTTPAAVDSLYEVLRRVMFKPVVQLDSGDPKDARARLLRFGALNSIDTMVKGGVVPNGVAEDLKKLHADSTLPADVRDTIARLLGAIALQKR